jgi:hypothetical protein
MAAPEEKKKPGLALVVGMGKPKPEEEAESGEGEAEYSASVDELFDSLKADDRAGFAASFKAAVMSCK